MNFLEKTLEANQQILAWNLSMLTWGNVSILNPKRTQMCIKPSGVELSKAISEEMSLVNLNGIHLSGKKPSVDTKTHLEIYNGFGSAFSVVHTHSKYATIFAQAEMDIPCLGTTHADYFLGHIPCICMPTQLQVEEDYELCTGKNIVNYFFENDIDPDYTCAALVKGHGVFCWGKNVDVALENALVLETIAEMAYKTRIMNPNICLPEYIMNKHFFRKNGGNKYYGQ